MSETLKKPAVKILRKFSGKLKATKFGTQPEAAENVLSSEIWFYSDGRIEKETRYSEDGEVDEIHEYIYDKDNKRVLHTWTMPLDGVEQSERTERDEKGKVIKEVKLYYGEEGDYCTYAYDEKERVIEQEQFDEEGKSVSKDVLTYNEEGKIIEKKTQDHLSDSSTRHIYVYNEKGYLQEHAELTGDGKADRKTIYTHDEQGNELIVIQYSAKGDVTQRLNNTYDENGKLVHRVAIGFYTRIYSYEYDERGNLILEFSTDENGTLINRSSYEYDEDGNLIYETVFEMDLTHSGRDVSFTSRYEYEMF